MAEDVRAGWRPLPAVAALVAVLGVALLAGCGEQPSMGAGPQRAIVARGLRWWWTVPGSVPPLSQRWSADDWGPWRLLSDAPQPEPLPPGLDRARAVEPSPPAPLPIPHWGWIADPTPVVQADLGPAVDPELQHTLVVTLRAEVAGSIDVAWRGDGEPFDDARSVPGMALIADGQAHDYAWPLSMLRGQGDASDAAAGLAGLRLVVHAAAEGTQHGSGRAVGEAGSDPSAGDQADPGTHTPLDPGTDADRDIDGDAGRERAEGLGLQLLAISLRSDFDVWPDGDHPGTHRVARDFAWCDGFALPTGSAVKASLPPGTEELRLLLATAGARPEAPQRPGLERGHAVPTSCRIDLGGKLALRKLQRGAAWREVRLPVPVGVRELTLECSGEATAALLVGRVLCIGAAAPDAPRRPNVVLYVEDTLRADRLGTYGYARHTDPHLRALAAEGAVVERVMASANWTRPAMASVFTSLTPPAHGNRSYRDRVPEALTTVAEAFADAGWLVVSFTSNYHAGSWAGLDQGVDLHHEPEAFGLPLAPDTRTAQRIHPLLERVLDEQGDLPLLLLVHSLDPHAPYAPDPADLAALAPGGRVPEGDGPTARSLRYDAEILGNDHWLARLDDALAARGLRDDTLVSFLSDHGEAFGEHGAWEHHDRLHLPELAVPWVLRWPGHIAPGTRLARWSSQLDVAPTLAGLAGVAAPSSWQGVDLSAALRGGTEPPAAPVFSECLRLPTQKDPVHRVSVVMDPLKLVLEVRGETLRPLTLHDLRADPGELSNLLGRPELASRIEALTAEARHALDGGAAPADGGDAAELDPARRQWMEQMGYLR